MPYLVKKYPRSLYIISYIVSMYSSIYALYLLKFQYIVTQFLSEARSPLCCVYTDLFNMLFGTILFQNIFNDWLSDIIQIRLQYRALYIYIYKNSLNLCILSCCILSTPCYVAGVIYHILSLSSGYFPFNLFQISAVSQNLAFTY